MWTSRYRVTGKAPSSPSWSKRGKRGWKAQIDKILALYARGMTTRDIQAQLQELYGVEVSPTLISNVTEAVMEEVRQWQSRPLESIYPIVYVDRMPRQCAREPACPELCALPGVGSGLERTERRGFPSGSPKPREPNSGSPC
jgi:hypothetical protein